MKINKAVLKLNAKPHNPFGIASLILVGIAFVLTVASVYVIAFQPQNRQNIILAGALEILGMTVTLAGIGVSVVGEEPDETEKIFVHRDWCYISLD